MENNYNESNFSKEEEKIIDQLKVSNSSNALTNTTPKKNIFFCMKEKNIKKDKPIVFTLNSVIKYVDDDDEYKGCWCSLIIRQQQENHNENYPQQSTFMLTGTEFKTNHIRIRMIAIKESLDWIINSVDQKIQKNIEINITCCDIFIVNLLKEWIRKWAKNDFKIDKEDRPNKDILSQIYNLIKHTKIDIKWESEESNNLKPLQNKIDRILMTI